MAKRSVEPARHVEAHQEGHKLPAPDLVIKGGGKLFKIGLPAPAVHYLIEAPTESDAVEGYDHLAGVITTEQKYEIEEITPPEPTKGAEPTKG